jgi:M6 family metalloprotease-like protein
MGQLQIQGTVLPKYYASEKSDSAYLARRPNEEGGYGEFVLEILRQVDDDYDLGQFDNDGADGIPNSGDDDGKVDYVFINLLSVPPNFILGKADGRANLGFSPEYMSADTAAQGIPIRVSGGFYRGAVLRASSFAKTASYMAHEFGHSLGPSFLPDLYDTSFQDDSGQPDAADGAGIGRWGLMGMGTRGWNDHDGPNPFSAWSREQLGWIGQENDRLIEVRDDTVGLVIADLDEGGHIYKIPLPAESADRGTDKLNYLLLEYRGRTAHHYDRNLPAEGLLVWHVRPGVGDNKLEGKKRVDLVCADGLYKDAGFDRGGQPDPYQGGDNLDFWAHKSSYSKSHEGNEGDATDVFDGIHYTRLDSDSNPSSHFGGVIAPALTGLALRMQRQGDHMVVDIRQPRWAGTIREQVHWAGDIIIDGDLHIAEEGNVFIYGGARVRFASEDRLRGGLDPTRCELHIQGELDIQSKKIYNLTTKTFDQPAPIVFEAYKPGGTWYGMVAEPAIDAQIEDANITLKDVRQNSDSAPIALEEDVPTAVEDERVEEALEFELRPNYPNPFGSRTTIPYTLAAAAPVRLVVYNALGQLVRTLVDEDQAEGAQEVVWDSQDERGQEAASGVYLYHLEVPGHYKKARRMLLLDGGLSQLLKLDAGLRDRGRNWSVLQSELQKSAPEVFGYAVQPSVDQVAFLAATLWIKLQALGQYSGDSRGAEAHAQQLEELLHYFDPSPAQLRAIKHFSGQLRGGDISPVEFAALFARVRPDLELLVQGHSEEAAAFFFLGHWFQGLKVAVQAARQPGLSLREIVDIESAGAAARQLAAYLDSLEAGEELKAALHNLADLLESSPRSRRELAALLDLLESLEDSLAPGP